ncbi:MAG: flavodoxin family protein [Deltaproteobacteria bacterium]|jgi:multimeric flavodoxin WrbA|nr:flavodoxin family protein [Deltaproteobacteria bacterium]
MASRETEPILGLHLGAKTKGSSALVLEHFRRGAEQAGSGMEIFSSAGREIEGCRACGSCDTTGRCVIEDGMEPIYEALEKASRIVISAPVYFYGLPSQGKALVDRVQIFWARQYKLRQKRTFSRPPQGLVLSLGATKGQDLFTPVILCTKYFFDSLEFPKKFPFVGFRKIETPADLTSEQLALAERCGRDFASDPFMADPAWS